MKKSPQHKTMVKQKHFKSFEPKPRAVRRSSEAKLFRKDQVKLHKRLTVEAQSAAIADNQLSSIGYPPRADTCTGGSCESGQSVIDVNTIARAATLKSNHCLFTAMMNTLLTQKERTAFGNGIAVHAEKAFEEFVQSRYDHDSDSGYCGSHILEYLKCLQRRGRIKSFVWKSLPNMTLQDLVRGKGIRGGTSVVMFGRATRTDVKDKVLSAISKVSTASWADQSEETRMLQIDAYINASVQRSNRAFSTHAAGIRFRDSNGIRNGEFVDGGKFVVKELSAVSIAQSMVELRINGKFETSYRAFSIEL